MKRTLTLPAVKQYLARCSEPVMFCLRVVLKFVLGTTNLKCLALPIIVTIDRMAIIALISDDGRFHSKLVSQVAKATMSAWPKMMVRFTVT